MGQQTQQSFRVLLVDDDDSFAKIVSIRLRDWNPDIEITFAGSLQAATEVLDAADQEFPLVIFDTHLPDGLGFQLFDHPALKDSALLSISSDESPELTAKNVGAGAHHFLGKRQVTSPLFVPLIEGIIARKALEKRLQDAELQQATMATIKTLVATLRHEINNPLGAVMGATYLLKHEGQLEESQVEAIRLIEDSGQRINQVIQQLCEAAELETVTKADEQVFHIPGDKPWED